MGPVIIDEVATLPGLGWQLRTWRREDGIATLLLTLPDHDEDGEELAYELTTDRVAAIWPLLRRWAETSRLSGGEAAGPPPAGPGDDGERQWATAQARRFIADGGGYYFGTTNMERVLRVLEAGPPPAAAPDDGQTIVLTPPSADRLTQARWLEALRKLGAGRDGLAWAAAQPSPRAAWEVADVDHVDWLTARLRLHEHRRHAALALGRLALPYAPEADAGEAVDALVLAAAVLRGEADTGRLRAAEARLNARVDHATASGELLRAVTCAIRVVRDPSLSLAAVALDVASAAWWGAELGHRTKAQEQARRACLDAIRAAIPYEVLETAVLRLLDG